VPQPTALPRALRKREKEENRKEQTEDKSNSVFLRILLPLLLVRKQFLLRSIMFMII
jgi:hypothetical protein